MGSKPIRDEVGEEVRTTKIYSEEIGEVLHETSGTEPGYTFTRDELYVRAVVTSDVLHPNLTAPNDYEKAWTQPVVPTQAAKSEAK